MENDGLSDCIGITMAALRKRRYTLTCYRGNSVFDILHHFNARWRLWKPNQSVLQKCLHFFLAWFLCGTAEMGAVTTREFAHEVERVLPEEELYDYHKRLSEGPVHFHRRSPGNTPLAGELVLPDQGWKLVWNRNSSMILGNAVQDFQDYLLTSMEIRVEIDGRDSLDDWCNHNQSIIAGTRDQMPQIGLSLKGPKDYEIVVAPNQVAICGYDERGVMYGLYNLEARMNLREAPFLPGNLHAVRHSLYETRMVQSWMGWMEFPDPLLSHLSHAGFDAIYVSPMANPNGDRTTAETSTDFYARILYRIRKQDPARIHDLISRAARYGIKVYTPIIYQYLGTPESEAGLRQLVRNIVEEFPEIQGYVLLTEGFWYKQWGGGHGASEEYMRDWAKNWGRAVGIVAEECHRVNPSIEILPWEYNIDFRPQNAGIKRFFIQQLPSDTIPLLTWENGKSFEWDGFRGHLRDYAIIQIGPAEVTQAQIEEARKRGMKVYSNAQTFVCGAQFQTIPYHPFPYQWYARYKALEEYGVNGTLESWTTGFTPNFMSELRAWYCWSGSPSLDELLNAIAARIFGEEQKENVLKAWDLFSQAIRLVPDTGPNMGTNNAIGNPLFLEEPPARTATFKYSWLDESMWMGYLGAEINPYWPYTLTRLVFVPDFTNQTNRAELYARSVSGIEMSGEASVLPVFLKYLRLAADKMEQGLKLYRQSALNSPASKKEQALREVIAAEQIHRMMLSSHAILEFEDLRLQLNSQRDPQKAGLILDRMETILSEEIERTELALLAVKRDSRLGFQYECDYIHTPYSLKEKLECLRETLQVHLPRRRVAINNGFPPSRE